MTLTIRTVTPDLWLALEDLFGKWGASNGCWCMYWRLGGTYRGRREGNKETLRKIVKRGPSPGLLAFDGDLPVGWCQLTPRDALPWLDRMRSALRQATVAPSVIPGGCHRRLQRALCPIGPARALVARRRTHRSRQRRKARSTHNPERNAAALNNPTEKIYPAYTRARSWHRPGGPRLAQLKSLDN
jgi:hypothetical protein